MLFIKPADLREIVTFPLFSDLVQCGFPSPAADYVEQRIDLESTVDPASQRDLLRQSKW